MLKGFPRVLQEAYDSMAGPVWLINDILEHLWPVNRLASNLLVVARKV
jgi:hypothetical protein